jgi:hypothetical protein
MDPTGRPERMTTHEFVERLKKLIENNVAGNTQLLTGFLDLIKEASQVSTSWSGNQVDVEELLSKCLEFNLAAYSVVSTQVLALLNGLLNAARSTLITKGVPGRSAEGTAVPRVDLQLAGRHGDRPSASFVLENRFDLPLALVFESTALIPTAGSALPASLVSFEPTTLLIPPRGEGVVQVVVTITSDFVVGQTYTATIRPLGFGDFGEKSVGLLVSILSAEAEAPSHPVAEPESEAGASRPVRKPRQLGKKRALRGTK